MRKLIVLVALLVPSVAHAWGEDDARKWVTRMKVPNVQEVLCASFDTDGNGYVSCSISYQDKDGNFRVMDLECPSMTNLFGRECRLPKPR